MEYKIVTEKPSIEGKSLIELCETGYYDTDKYYNHRWRVHSYVENFYQENFTPIKDKVTNVLEIGVYSGGSALLWRDFFPNANIHSMDINYCNEITGQQRIHQVIGDAYSDAIANAIKDNYYDIIIDDGPHTLESMWHFLNKYLSKLKKGGILVVEDIPDSDWLDELYKCIPKDLMKNTGVVDIREKDNRFDSILLYIKT